MMTLRVNLANFSFEAVMNFPGITSIRAKANFELKGPIRRQLRPGMIFGLKKPINNNYYFFIFTKKNIDFGPRIVSE